MSRATLSVLRGPRNAQTGLASHCLRSLQVLHDGTAVVAGSDDGQVCQCWSMHTVLGQTL